MGLLDRHDEDRAEGAVTLSTIHQAKGLEWKAVFVVHVQDDVLPHRLSQGDIDAEDEERRLLYVAVTRAEELLYLSFPQLSVQRDFQRLINKPSRFVRGRSTSTPPAVRNSVIGIIAKKNSSTSPPRPSEASAGSHDGLPDV